MKILLDECLPIQLKDWLTGHDISTVGSMGWSGAKDGKLLTLAEDAGFYLLLTADVKMCGQHNMNNKRLAVLAIPTNNARLIKEILPQIQESLDHAKQGSFLILRMEDKKDLWQESACAGTHRESHVLIRRYRRPEQP